MNEPTIEEAPKKKAPKKLFNKTPVRKPIKRIIKIGRNDPCGCGSGKKFKRCCINRVKMYGV